jgi:hypothetical protein
VEFQTFLPLITGSCKTETICRRIEFIMNMRRLFAGSIVALLLSVSPLAAACDISCAFASINSDCHLQKTESQDSASAAMKMDGMAMDGMTMPETAQSESQQASSTISRAIANHPSIGEMGPCEKKSCDSDSADSAKANRSYAPRRDFVPAIIEIHLADSAPSIFHDARDDIATHHVRDGSPLHTSLRI